MVKKYLFAVLIPFLALFSCTSEPVTPAPVSKPKPSPPVEVVKEAAPPPAEEVFNPASVPQEVYEATLVDIQGLVENLNKIIRARNFDQWTSNLSDDYLKKINSKEFIEDLVAKYPAFRGRVTNARQYFTAVVVPSHSNDHVESIEFVSFTRVTAYTPPFGQASTTVNAYTKDSQGDLVILYNLEFLDGVWKIADTN